jgi:hypothetical protein
MTQQRPVGDAVVVQAAVMLLSRSEGWPLDVVIRENPLATHGRTTQKGHLPGASVEWA